MKSTGIIRNVDGLGRIVLPKELRKAFGIGTDTPLEIFTDKEGIVLRRYKPAGACDFCGEVSPDAALFHGKYICAACRRAIGEL